MIFLILFLRSIEATIKSFVLGLENISLIKERRRVKKNFKFPDTLFFFT